MNLLYWPINSLLNMNYFPDSYSVLKQAPNRQERYTTPPKPTILIKYPQKLSCSRKQSEGLLALALCPLVMWYHYSI